MCCKRNGIILKELEVGPTLEDILNIQSNGILHEV
jgi:hypothetical protein